MCPSSSPTTSRSSSARTGLRPAGDHRDLLDRARPRPRRHPLLPVRPRGGGPRRRARPVPRHGVQERAGRARPRRRQGRHLGRPGTDKTEALLRAYGRFVQSLGGRYYTACDVGTYVQDMDVVARETPVRDRPVQREHGGAGDSSVLTAWGVFQGMRACRRAPVGQPRRCAGAGSASPAWARSAGTWSGHLLEDGAAVVVTDVSAGRGGGGHRRRTRRSTRSRTWTR